MTKIHLKNYEIILYFITILTLLEMIPISIFESVRYKLLLACGLILFGYATIIIAKTKSITIKILYIVCLINTFSILANGDNVYDYLYSVFDIITWMLVMIATYGMVSMKKQLQTNRNHLYLCFVMISFISLYLLFKPSLVSTYREWTNVMYYPYYLVCLLSAVLLIDGKVKIFGFQIKYFKLIFIALTFILILFSSKRGGFIALLGGLAVYYLTIVIISPKKRLKKKYIRNIVLLILAALVVLIVLDRSGVFSIFSRLATIDWTDSGTSGRLSIWTEILNAYSEGSIVQQLFGFGYNATYNYTSYQVSGHNDFINNLFDYGLISLVLQIIVIISLIVLYVRLVKKKSTMAPALGYSIVVLLVLAMVSGCIYRSGVSLMMAFTWGIILGNAEKKQNQMTGTKNILLV